jgi:8-amino-7-oxononanoate synthase
MAFPVSGDAASGDAVPGGQEFVRDTLNAIRRAGLGRRLRDLEGAPGPRIRLNGRDVLLLCSNNYLGLATDQRLKKAACQAIETYGCGATGSRLISGNCEPYQELEREVAEFKGTEAALVFSSGYHANLGAITALVEAGDAIFSDQRNHASLIDGARLSKAEILIYRHADAEDLESRLRSRASARRRLIITEAVFSMDGDLAPLSEIAFLSRKYGATLLVDEAHATGVFGPTGAGLVEHLGLVSQVDIQMGTFSKALGSLGGYLAASRELIDYFLNRARAFIFTTGLPPGVVAASAEAIRIVRQEPERRAALWQNAERLRTGLHDIGFELGPTKSPILPLLLHDERRTMAACRFLLRHGVFVQGIRPPTVPAGTARLRIAPMATHRNDEMRDALGVFGNLQSCLHSPQRQARVREAALPAALEVPR